MSLTQYLINKDGTSQRDRFLKALDPAYFQVDERKLEDWYAYVQRLSAEIAFYQSNPHKYDQTWEDLFPRLSDVRNLPAGDVPPHLALTLAFFEALDVLKQDVNRLTEKHLDFYYRDILRTRLQASEPDKVHVYFELARNADTLKIEKGSLLKTKKGIDGVDLIYKTDREIVLNKAKIASVKTVFVDKKNEDRIYASPVANSSDGQGAALSPLHPSWSTFGESQFGKSQDERSMVEAEIGFMIASPILVLNEGTRKITVSLRFSSRVLKEENIEFLDATFGLSTEEREQLTSIRDEEFADLVNMESRLMELLPGNSLLAARVIAELGNPLRHVDPTGWSEAFHVYGHGGKGPFRLMLNNVSKKDENQLDFALELKPGDPGLLPFPGAGTYPAFKFVLDPFASIYTYAPLKSLLIEALDITVDVSGLQNIIVANDNGPLDGAQAFFPFGASPSIGSSFYFGNQEIYSKKLDILKLMFQWLDLPEIDGGFPVYYDKYKDTSPFPNDLANLSFASTFYYLKDGIWQLLRSNFELFDSSGTGPTLRLNPNPFIRILGEDLPMDRNPELTEHLQFRKGLVDGFFKFSLNSPAFGHQIYPKINTAAAIDIAGGTDTELPNPPYTPKLGFFSLDYISSVSTQLTDPQAFETIYHVEPFGIIQTNPETNTYLLPQFSPGTLLIGIDQIKPLQQVDILFQMLEGSGNKDVDVMKEDISWSYLTEKGWTPILNESIQVDSTQGLQTTGIIRLALGKDSDDNSPLFPEKHHWLKGSFLNDPAGINRMINMQTQAVSVTYVDQKNAPSHLLQPLPPNAIKRFVNPVRSVKKIHQPYASFGGKQQESDRNHRKRISERLRHKQRGISAWDLERIVLEAFPEIYKLKTINHSDTDTDLRPGNVVLIAIPQIWNRNGVDILQPKTSSVLRNRITTFLQKHISPWAKISVENPQYEPLLVEVDIRLRVGFDGAFYKTLLNRELIEFLSPWAFEASEDIVFGGRIHASRIIEFIEKREYVDHVLNFNLLHISRGGGLGTLQIKHPADLTLEAPDTFRIFSTEQGVAVSEYAEASTARSILVSSSIHKINILTPDDENCQQSFQGGIGSMGIHVDFQVF